MKYRWYMVGATKTLQPTCPSTLSISWLIFATSWSSIQLPLCGTPTSLLLDLASYFWPKLRCLSVLIANHILTKNVNVVTGETGEPLKEIGKLGVGFEKEMLRSWVFKELNFTRLRRPIGKSRQDRRQE